MEADELNDYQFTGYSFFHIEGYLVQNHDLILKAVNLAKKTGLTISIDMASFTTVDANKDFLLDIVKNYVNIVFANEEEARSFTGEDRKKQPGSLANIVIRLWLKSGKRDQLYMRV